MYNWSTDEKELKKTPEKYACWKLQQLINYGLNGEKLYERDLRTYWSKLVIDPARKKFLALLFYGTSDTR